MTTKTITFTVEITTEIPFIEGRTNLEKEIDNMMEVIADTYDFQCWDYVVKPKEFNQ